MVVGGRGHLGRAAGLHDRARVISRISPWHQDGKQDEKRPEDDYIGGFESAYQGLSDSSLMKCSQTSENSVLVFAATTKQRLLPSLSRVLLEGCKPSSGSRWTAFSSWLRVNRSWTGDHLSMIFLSCSWSAATINESRGANLGGSWINPLTAKPSSFISCCLCRSKCHCFHDSFLAAYWETRTSAWTVFLRWRTT